jgi:aryl-alcohol dehydrogenase-like predicted oxidoreductase
VETRALGSGHLRVTRVGLGAWAIGGLMWGGGDESDAADAIRASLDAGINWIDTAPAYGCGRSEEIVGRAIEGRRHEVLVATKCGLRWDRSDGEMRFDVADPDGGRVRIYYNLRPDSLREECEASLRRLGVESIDLYQIHWPYPPHPLDDAFDALVRLREEGKVRELGVSNFGVDDLRVALRCGNIVSAQPPFNLVDRRIEPEILPWCREHGVGVVAYSPMGRGLLTGKLDLQTEFPESDHRHANPAFQKEQREKLMPALEKARPLAADRGISLGNLAVAWVLATPGITAALVGARNAEQACENARAADVVLTAEEWRELAEIFPALPWSSPTGGPAVRR